MTRYPDPWKSPLTVGETGDLTCGSWGSHMRKLGISRIAKLLFARRLHGMFAFWQGMA